MAKARKTEATAAEETQASIKATPVLLTRYREEIAPALINEFKYSNAMQAPRIEKVIINIGMGEAMDAPKMLDAAVEDLRQITGQQPVITKAKKSIAQFKLREGRAIGVKVTLRGEKMWALLDRLVNIALPRIRDFRGVPNKLDGRGNYTIPARAVGVPRDPVR
jgi:large subunit ribosomal protein L5